jgi:hypothetical protein
VRYVIHHAATSRQMRGVSSIAAPLLAAAALTVIGVVVQAPTALALPSISLAVLVIAAAALITSVNANVWVAYYECEPLGDQLETQIDTPTMDDDDYRSARRLYNALSFWVRVSRWSYSFGVYALWIGVGLCLVPKPFSWARVPALAAVGAAIVTEAVLYRLAPKSAVEPAVWLIAHERRGRRTHT